MSKEKKTKKLGRGFGALLGDDLGASDASELQISDIHPNRYQPRRSFDEGALLELALSIKAHGVVQPVIVRSAADGYELIAGERRLRAAKMAGLDTIPAIVRDYSDKDSAEIALIENLQREDLDDIEEGMAYDRLMNEYGFSQKDMAEAVGKSRSYIANTLRLLSLPDEIKSCIREGKVTGGQVRPLLTLDSAAEQLQMARYIMEHDLSARQVEDLIRRKKEMKNKGKKDKEKNDNGSSWIAEVEDRMHTSLGSPVKISFGKGRNAQKGKITISFKNEQEFERLMKRFTEE